MESFRRFGETKETEDVFITQNGRVIAKLTNPHQNRIDTAKSLFGILPSEASIDDAWEERLDTV